MGKRKGEPISQHDEIATKRRKIEIFSFYSSVNYIQDVISNNINVTELKVRVHRKHVKGNAFFIPFF